MELGVHLDPGQVEIEPVEQRAVRQPGRTKELRLGQLEEADIGPVEDDPGRVHVGPADVLLDDERVRHGG